MTDNGAADWDDVADTYESKFEHTTGFVLAHYLNYVAPGSGLVVADVGCGPGVVALACADAGARVKALDISAAMVDRLRVRADERGVGALVEGFVGDAAALPFADAECDAAVSNFGVIFCPDIDAALREMARVTKPGGALMIGAWTTEARNGWTTLLPDDYAERLGFSVQPRPMYRWQSSEELQATCERAGWMEVSIDTVSSRSTVLASAAAMRDLFDTPPSKVALSRLSDEQVGALMELLIARATEEFGDGEVALPREAWLARGRA